MTKKFLTPIVLPADPAAAMEAVTKQYVDARAGSEVEISATDPIGTNPTVELWIDSDEPALLTNDLRWNTAWGVVGSVLGPSADTALTPVSTNDAIAGLTVTFTALSTRRYKTTVEVNYAVGASPGFFAVDICSPGPTSLVSRAVTGAANDWLTLHAEIVESGLSGSVTRLATGYYSAGTLTVHGGGRQSRIVVEDIGPVAASIPVSNPLPQWIALGYNSANWTNMGAGNMPLAYRIVGDEVQVRGEVHFASGGANPMAYLPVGYRPTASLTFPALNRTSTTAVLQLIVYNDGAMSIMGLSGTTDFSINTVRFSVL